MRIRELEYSWRLHEEAVGRSDHEKRRPNFAPFGMSGDILSKVESGWRNLTLIYNVVSQATC